MFGPHIYLILIKLHDNLFDHSVCFTPISASDESLEDAIVPQSQQSFRDKVTSLGNLKSIKNI